MTKLIICRCGQQYQLPAHQSVAGMSCHRCGSTLSDLAESIDEGSGIDAKLLKWVASGVLTVLIIALLVLVIIPKLNRSPDQPIAQGPDNHPSATDSGGRDSQTPSPNNANTGKPDIADKDAAITQPSKDSQANTQAKDNGTGKQPTDVSPTAKKEPDPQIKPKPLAPKNELAVYRQARKFAVSADGRVIVTYAIDDPNRTTNVKIELIAWNAETGEKRQSLQRAGITTALAVSHDGRFVVTTGRGTPGPVALRLWNIETGKLVQSFDVLLPDSWFGFSSDNETALCFVPKQGLFTIATKTGRFQLFNTMPVTATEAAFSHTNAIALLKHNSGRGGQWLDVFPVATKRVSQSIRKGTIGSFALSPDGKTVAAGHRGEINLFAASNGNEIKSLERSGMRLAPVMLQFSHDARYLLEMPYGADGNQPAVWDIESKTRRELNGGDAIQVAACERGIVVLDQARRIRLFDFATGQAINTSPVKASE